MTPKPIRVMFDEQIFLLQEFGGISRYFTELIKAFESNPALGVKPLLSSNSVRNKYLLEETNSFSLNAVKTKLGASFHLLKQIVFNRKVQNSADLVHQTFYLPGFYRRFSKLPKALTLFDMIPEKTQSHRKFWNPHFMKRYVLPKSDVLFSISQSSTKDMISKYGFKLNAITTYLGVGSEFQPNLPGLDWLPKRYFLFVGNRDGYKDWETAVRSFAKVSNQVSGAFLLLVGGGPLRVSEKDLISSLNIKGLVTQTSVNETELPNVYSNAIGLIYPSRYEGFGLPLVEAMASATPILASKTPINTEIAANCASFFPTGDQFRLAELMLQLVSDPPSFQDKIRLGELRSKDFTWGKCAEITAMEYRRIIEKEKVKG
jgi:glycosyltransferase involved in cell wall biosynthesis